MSFSLSYDRLVGRGVMIETVSELGRLVQQLGRHAEL